MLWTWLLPPPRQLVSKSLLESTFRLEMALVQDERLSDIILGLGWKFNHLNQVRQDATVSFLLTHISQQRSPTLPCCPPEVWRWPFRWLDGRKRSERLDWGYHDQGVRRSRLDSISSSLQGVNKIPKAISTLLASTLPYRLSIPGSASATNQLSAVRTSSVPMLSKSLGYKPFFYALMSVIRSAFYDGQRTSDQTGDFIFNVVIPSLKRACPGKKIHITE